MEGFDPMICSQCGGKVSAKEGTFKELEGGGFFYYGTDTVKCESCGTEFTPNSQVPKFVAVQNVKMGDRSVFVGGNMNGMIVVGNNNVVGKKRKDDQEE